MALPTNELIKGLIDAANKIENGAYYAWGHHGACNCGHLLQACTTLSKDEIRKYATSGIGEWSEIAQGECEITGAPFELLLKKMHDLGLSASDIHHLEYLSDRDVLDFIPGGFRWLARNKREDVITYFKAMAEMLSMKLKRFELLDTTESKQEKIEKVAFA
jgi:hypothetical protein